MWLYGSEFRHVVLQVVFKQEKVKIPQSALSFEKYCVICYGSVNIACTEVSNKTCFDFTVNHWASFRQFPTKHSAFLKCFLFSRAMLKNAENWGRCKPSCFLKPKQSRMHVPWNFSSL